MCSAKKNAPATVSISPRPMASPCSEISPSPTVASTTATHTADGTRRRSTTAPISGVNTTNSPVTKPDTDAEAV